MAGQTPPRVPRLLAIGAVIVFASSGGSLIVHAQTGTAAIWLQTMDSCKHTLGQSRFRISDSSGAFEATVTTPPSPLHPVASGKCPIPRGNCSTSTDGCVQVTGLPLADSFRIRQTATPPSNSGNPLGFAPCNGGSACRDEFARVAISGGGVVSAQTSNVFPDGTTRVFPSSSSSYSGAAADPIVFHDYGLGYGSCDSDGDADDSLSGTPSSHCAYLPEDQEAAACQPYPWSCTLTQASDATGNLTGGSQGQ